MNQRTKHSLEINQRGRRIKEYLLFFIWGGDTFQISFETAKFCCWKVEALPEVSTEVG